MAYEVQNPMTYWPLGNVPTAQQSRSRHGDGRLATCTALGLGRFNPWLVNIDAEYEESGPAA